MPFPDGLPTTLVTYLAKNPAGGGPAVGSVEFAPTVPAIAVPDFGQVYSGRGTYKFNSAGQLVDAAGGVGVRLLPNDVDGANPKTWYWMVTFRIKGIPDYTSYIKLSVSQTEVDLGTIEQVDPDKAMYVLVPGPEGPKGDTGAQGPPGSGGGAVDSVNDETGDVVLDAAKVGADVAGAAATAQAAAATDATTKASAAQTAAIANAHTYTDASLTAEVTRADAAYDPAGAASTAQTAATTAAASDATAKVAAHQADTTNVHGIADTSALETGAGATAKVAAHTVGTDPHGDRAAAAAALAAHEADTTAVHGITNTAALVVTSDTRLADSRTPTGTASGDLSGTYPGPTVTKVNGVTVTGTPAAGQVLTATSGTAAGWAALSGGGSSIVSDDGRINEHIIVLPTAASWTIVTTSLGVEIGKKIPASVGDHLWYSPSFLRTYGFYLDMGIKAAAGGVSRYTSSGASTPEEAGYAPMYPESAFAGIAGMREFVVQEGEVDGDGNAMIVIAYKGADGVNHKMYFGDGYSGAIFVANMGPQS